MADNRAGVKADDRLIEDLREIPDDEDRMAALAKAVGVTK